MDSATSLVTWRDLHADAARMTRAAGAQLVGHPHGLVDGDRERDAHEAARAAVDLRVDAHHLAAQVDQRPARVAGVDRHVGLDEGQVVAGVALPSR
jgi:hypothetical protein